MNGRLTLFSSLTSPYVRKVRVLIREAGIVGIDEIMGGGTPLDQTGAPVGQNPLGKVPALVTDTGEALFDSRVICRWLDDHAGAGLYPGGEALWRVLVLESLADGILDAALLMIYESRLRPEEIRFAPWVESQWLKVARSLDTLENGWAGDLEQPLNMGQIALGCALGYLDFRHSARNWRDGHPRLAAWEEAFARRAPMRETRPVG
ncbi:glutathione S-transferase family protein [Pseudogemmobacter humi]|uniref:Putative GST-like protein YibF n=1 Tax=Pseudogemmobacter humi TaxID=2483812 RepID=A0A3P5X7B3_9RHOB|nr:glutathione S-transferase family protein [Pseudogemmobacter humi]VDC23224.1 putative GST-like protein YibF [Pseudogemmobacter humi]